MMEGGIDKRRLEAMADFIEGLPMAPDRGQAPGPVGNAKHVHGSIPCLGYVLRPGGEGYGLVVFDADKQQGEAGRRVVEGISRKAGSDSVA